MNKQWTERPTDQINGNPVGEGQSRLQAFSDVRKRRHICIFVSKNRNLTNRFREGFVFSYISAVVGGRHPYNPLEVSAEKAL